MNVLLAIIDFYGQLRESNISMGLEKAENILFTSSYLISGLVRVTAHILLKSCLLCSHYFLPYIPLT